jgi:formylglycine-generating enzyme required for sulfatase activity
MSRASLVMGAALLAAAGALGGNECPEYMSLVEAGPKGLCIDQFESAVEVVGGAGHRLHPFYLPVDGLRVRAVSTKGVHYPQAYISADQAKGACAEAGKHLCTLSEWRSACPLQYPYGSKFRDGFCNTGRQNPVIRIFGKNASFSFAEMNDPRLDQLPLSLSPSGNFSRCVTNNQVFDMAGNLDEWVDHINPHTGHGTFKGGYFVDDVINGRGCAYETVAHSPKYHDYSLGFRCCLSSGPGSLHDTPAAASDVNRLQ